MKNVRIHQDILVCPSCHAMNPEREFVDMPLFEETATGYIGGCGYRCMVCREISEPEDWNHESGKFCPDCQKEECSCPVQV